MSNAAEELRKLAKKAADERLKVINAESEKRINEDIEIINKILEMVKDRLVYKEYTPEHSSRKQYILVTEDIVLHDYNNPPKYGSGTNIKYVESSYYTYEHIAITVNGHYYYHAKDLISKYEHEAQKVMDKAEREYEIARERKEAIDNLSELEPVMKELMLNYNKHLGLVKE